MLSDKFILGKSEEILTGLKKESIGLVITSPPYKNSDGFSFELMYNVFSRVFRVQKNNSLLFLNFGHLAEDKFRPFEVCHLMKEIGYKLNETIVWVKNHYRPIQGKRRLNNLTEFIFMLHKGKMPEIDRLSIGVPYKDKSNVGRYSDVDLKCGGNVWFIPYDTIQSKDEKLHNDRFPVGLPEKCIRLSGLKDGIVLDPFAGIGTTCLAVQNERCKERKIYFFGCEKNKTHYNTAINLINKNDSKRITA